MQCEKLLGGRPREHQKRGNKKSVKSITPIHYNVIHIYIFREMFYTVEPLYSGDPWGTTFWPLYRVAFIGGFLGTQTVYLGPGCLAIISQLAFIQGWPLRGVPLVL